MNLIVHGLEKRGIITRAPSKNHGRKQDTNLSEKGIRKLKKAHMLVGTVESDLFSVLADDEKMALKSLLSKLNKR
jgi:DNA-binding MarR family transcriptional regulator